MGFNESFLSDERQSAIRPHRWLSFSIVELTWSLGRAILLSGAILGDCSKANCIDDATK